MTTQDADQFWNKVVMRYLGIDYGLKRTGLAVCDRDETITSPLAVINTDKQIIDKIIDIIRKYEVESVVIGLPINMDGSAGEQAAIVKAFAKQLEEAITIPIHFQDERLSSYSASEKLAPAELSRKKKKQKLDAVAAAEILDDFLRNTDR
jgi:putative Holliday junction resolvase